jgi:hypothetical protein
VSYFHWPSEVCDELASSGFEVFRVFGVEGPGWIASDFEARWNTPRIAALCLKLPGQQKSIRNIRSSALIYWLSATSEIFDPEGQI